MKRDDKDFATGKGAIEYRECGPTDPNYDPRKAFAERLAKQHPAIVDGKPVKK
jgi:hypothetical protein